MGEQPQDATIRPFLMFEGKAEEALNYYLSVFPDGKLLESTRYGPGQVGKEGSVATAVFVVAGQTIMCSDSPVKHAFGFTPAFSLFVDCQSEAVFDRVWSALSQECSVFMPPGDYGFSRWFGWLSDRYGVSWQISLRTSPRSER
ncbi:MAG: VOC family protein [Rhizomicrobium sp.]|jgi:predicted 3-demethylubiquinone-9 3-methyltransferase (glyoxalase superfamily)